MRLIKIVVHIISALSGPLIVLGSNSASADICSDRMAVELQKSTFSICKGCHTKREIAPNWLSGSEAEVLINVKKILKNPNYPYASVSENLLIAKPFSPSVTHGGGKSFSADIRSNIVLLLSDLDSRQCLQGIRQDNSTSVDTPAPVSEKFLIAAPTYSQLEHFLQNLTRNSNGKTMQSLYQYRNQLGFSQSRTQSDSRLPISPVSMAVLNKLLSWGCAEVVDRRDWAAIPRSQFHQVLTDFTIEILGLPWPESEALAKSILSQEDERTRMGKSLRASRVSACYTLLKSERLWLR